MDNCEITIDEGRRPGKKNSLKIYVYFKNKRNLLKELGGWRGLRWGELSRLGKYRSPLGFKTEIYFKLVKTNLTKSTGIRCIKERQRQRDNYAFE